jgi:exopolyphosphatase/guanosine-5'-triphosphate,3'-diphosphate pyrophosphatase
LPRSRRPTSATPLALPARFGVADVGSNAIRLLVVEIREAASQPGAAGAGARPAVLESAREPVRLGQDVFLTGSIPESSIAAAVEALRRFKLLCDRYEVRGIRAVATAAVREATNRDVILERIEKATGIRLEVISGTEEAYLLTRAVETRVDLSKGRSLVVDLGGGSVEVTLIEDGQIALSDSYRLGAVRLLEALSADAKGGEGASLLDLLDQYVGSLDSRIAERLGGGRIERFVATGGNIEALAELAAREAPLRSEGGVDALPRKLLADWIQRLARMPFAARVEELGLSRDRADVILPAAVVYYRLASVARADRILVPRVGLRDGLVRDVVSGHLETALAADRRETVLAGARALARKYHSEIAHAEKVRELAVELFDALLPLHGLGAEERVLLEASAVLHDIGAFVSASGHHKHSYYLIRASDLVGLAADERELVGLVARYHRRSHPKRTHPGFAELAREDRDVVTKLAALLRLADALDREHQAKVARIEVKLGKRAVELVLVPEDRRQRELALERWAVRRKGTLFTEAFGLPVQVAP